MRAIKHDQAARPAGPSRRQFLVGAAAAGAGLTIGFHIPLGPAGRALAAQADAVNPINAYLRIAPDGTVTVLSAHMDGGQGIYTGVATLVAEELDADWSKLRVEGAAGNPKLYGNLTWGGTVQGTGGSSSTPAPGSATGAQARWRARCWSRRRPRPGMCRRPRSGSSRACSAMPPGKSASFGELADGRRRSRRPADVKLKDPSAWVYIGNDKLRRLDSVAKTTGRQRFPIDVRLPGMLTAVLARPPCSAPRRNRSTPRRPGRSRAWSTWSRRRAGSRSSPGHLVGAQGTGPSDRRVGRERGRDPRHGRADGRVQGARPRRCRGRPAARATPRARSPARPGHRGRVRVPLSRACRDGAARCGRALSGRHARDLGRTPDARSLSGGQRRDHGHRPGEGEAARDDAGRLLRPAGGRRRRRDRRGRERPQGDRRARRRSRCSGPARTT